MFTTVGECDRCSLQNSKCFLSNLSIFERAEIESDIIITNDNDFHYFWRITEVPPQHLNKSTRIFTIFENVTGTLIQHPVCERHG